MPLDTRNHPAHRPTTPQVQYWHDVDAEELVEEDSDSDSA
jgi:hypothetical protein